MVEAEDSGTDVESLLIHLDGLGGPACVPVGDGKVVARGQGQGVIGAEDALAVSEDLFVQRDGLVSAPC